MTQYREILKRGWKISWKTKYFWFLGLFATLLTSSEVYEIVAKALRGDMTGVPFSGLSKLLGTVFSQLTFSNIGYVMANEPLALSKIILFFTIVFLVSCFVLWISIVSQIGLVNNTFLKISKKDNSFEGAIYSGKRNFWQVLILNLIQRFGYYLGFFIIGMPFVFGFFNQDAIFDNLIFTIAFIIFILLAIVLSFIIKYSIAYVVIKGEKLVNSIKKGWKLFSDNWLVSLEIAMILFALEFVVNLVMFMALLFNMAVFFTAIVLQGYSLFGFWILLLIDIALFILLVVFPRSLLTAFQIASWTDLFTILHGKGAVSKLARISKELVKK